jgi:hypothetical protein
LSILRILYNNIHLHKIKIIAKYLHFLSISLYINIRVVYIIGVMRDITTNERARQ